MPHFGQDVGRAFDSAVIRAGNAAYGAYVRCGAWSAQQLMDGAVPREIAKRIATAPQIRKLVEVGLWVETADGYQMTAWTEDGNRTRSEVESVSAARAKAGARGGSASGESRRRAAAARHQQADSAPDREAVEGRFAHDSQGTWGAVRDRSEHESHGTFDGQTTPDLQVLEASASSKTNPLPSPTLPYPQQTPSVSAGAMALAEATTRATQAWVEACGVRPGRRDVAAVQQEIAELLDNGNPPDAVTEAARRAGHAGFARIGIELRKLAAANRPQTAPRRPAESRVAGWQALKSRPGPAVPEPVGEVINLPPLRAVGADPC